AHRDSSRQDFLQGLDHEERVVRIDGVLQGRLGQDRGNKVTQASKSARRSRSAIGNACVIPAKAGIQVSETNALHAATWAPACAGATMATWARFCVNDSRLVPAKAGIQCR